MQHAKPISDLVVQRWKDAGAVFGWQDQWGYYSDERSEDDDLPAFLFDNNWHREELCDLPDAGIAFRT
ncbi:MAG: hypothetical protein NT069_29520 [Planctomycetota bacterium]|nr:hypothetical protein [Planctomycetota bacterium]